MIARGTAGPNGDADIADAGRVETLLQIDQPFPNHNGGMLAFGPDGDLYVGMGDGGSGGDPQGNGQSLDTLLGKILRIDVTSDPGGDALRRPADNPFVGTAGASPRSGPTGCATRGASASTARPATCGSATSARTRCEEVDVARAADGGGRGLDFGWNRMEGPHCFDAGRRAATSPG